MRDAICGYYFYCILHASEMHKKSTSIIRSGASLLMLFIFSLSITPKIFLHDITANHKDETAIIIHDEHDQHVDEKGFSCDTLNLVATSPFEEVQAISLADCAIVYPAYSTEFTSRFYTRTYKLTSLRGPPAMNSFLL